MMQATDGARAATGEPVTIVLNPIRADKREQFEHLVNEILRPAVEENYPGVVQSVRYLAPAEPNEKGHYLYVFLFDPVIDDVDYSISNLFSRQYGATKGQEYVEHWTECFASRPVIIPTLQTYG